ncbi:hypothetical protein MM239_08405 [Belliella sp. DSM 111904]|uniref:Uncharacterized protein n=1 Tax=Belliella filtrata TaxID=2923435 RepID=A0ABS9UZ17_9BACT|nr:hypothetical protein [Belliella filtrata]MCH7409412.1 hypothetical protein [Belliella filtrata]
MKVIKDQFIKSSILKRKRSKSESIEIPSSINNIGVLVDDQVSFNGTLDSLKKYFKNNVDISGHYLGEKEDELGVSIGDFSLFGKPNEKILKFLSQKFDFIIVPTLKLSPYLLYLLVNSSCGFKVGFYSEENKDFLDLMIESKSKETETTIQQLLDNLLKVKSAC